MKKLLALILVALMLTGCVAVPVYDGGYYSYYGSYYPYYQHYPYYPYYPYYPSYRYYRHGPYWR